jgi:hypothetical protein
VRPQKTVLKHRAPASSDPDKSQADGSVIAGARQEFSHARKEEIAMKNSSTGWASIYAFAVAALLIGSVPAIAQQTTSIRVSIPFEFHVGNTILPAGTYMVRSSGSSGALSFSDGQGHTASSITNGVPNRLKDSRDYAQLVFNVYGGNKYFLGEVRWNGYSTARGLLKSSLETEVARNMATKPATETVAVAK